MRSFLIKNAEFLNKNSEFLNKNATVKCASKSPIFLKKKLKPLQCIYSDEDFPSCRQLYRYQHWRIMLLTSSGWNWYLTNIHFKKSCICTNLQLIIILAKQDHISATTELVRDILQCLTLNESKDNFDLSFSKGKTLREKNRSM